MKRTACKLAAVALLALAITGCEDDEAPVLGAFGTPPRFSIDQVNITVETSEPATFVNTPSGPNAVPTVTSTTTVDLQFTPPAGGPENVQIDATRSGGPTEGASSMNVEVIF